MIVLHQIASSKRILFQLSRHMAQVKLTSYNVLSSNLCEPSYFKACNPSYLAPEFRLETLKGKLADSIHTKSVICLQEVSQKWTGDLHVFFSSRGYHLITAPYGNKFDGYMGVAMAIPLDAYEITDVDITRIADSKILPKSPKAKGFFNVSKDKIAKVYRAVGRILGYYRDPIELWDSVTHRHNQMISVRLKSKESHQTFVVGNYHMPCMFKLPSVMMAHCALSAQHLQRFANGDPHVYAGDFNIKPDSTMYRLLTEGTVEKTHPDYPLPPPGDDWEPSLSAMKSAYAAATGREPDFTNYAQVLDQEPFIDTLDYIFHSAEWAVKDVLQLPHRSEVAGPLPIQTEPSDHIMIAATLELPPANK